MTDYEKKLDPAQELFWHNIMEAMKNTTKTEILRKLEVIEGKTNLIEGITHAWATMFKSGRENVEKVYPNKKK
jgi:hypothetical protein